MEVKISWTDAEKKVLEYMDSENEKLFLKFCADNWYRGYFLSKCGTTGIQGHLRKKFCTTNPAKGDDLLVLLQAFTIKIKHDSFWDVYEYDEIIEFLDKLRTKYRSKIIKSIGQVAIEMVTWVIEELLARGFKHTLDIEKKDGFVIEVRSKNVPLVYPRIFASRLMAKKIFRRWAIKPLCIIKQYE